jgi:hypothetical protein
MVFFVLKGGEYALRYLRYKQLSRKIVKMSLVDKELKLLKFTEIVYIYIIYLLKFQTYITDKIDLVEQSIIIYDTLAIMLASIYLLKQISLQGRFKF